MASSQKNASIRLQRQREIRERRMRLLQQTVPQQPTYYPKNSMVVVIPSRKQPAAVQSRQNEKGSTTAATAGASSQQTEEKTTKTNKLAGDSSPSKPKATQRNPVNPPIQEEGAKQPSASTLTYATNGATNKSLLTPQKPEEGHSLLPEDSLSVKAQEQPSRSPEPKRRESLHDNQIYKHFIHNKGVESPPKPHVLPAIDSRSRSSSNSSTE